MFDRFAALAKIRAHFSQPGATLAWGVVDMCDGYEPETGCVYRDGGNPASPVRCAFGVLIPDELYEPNMENITCPSVIESNARLSEALGHPTMADTEWMRRVQYLHDNAAGTYQDDPAGVADFLRRLDDTEKTMREAEADGA